MGVETLNVLTLGSLFSGIGGIELGFERTGRFRTVWQCEFDPYASAVLAKHWPGVPNLGDITKVDWSKVEKPDVICGGFPCQDISVAGKGKGIAEGTRSGLWSEYLKAIREVRPRYAVIENVSMLSNRGLDIVLAGLAEAGYDAEWFTLRASDVGAPHRRERLFIIACNADNPRQGIRRDEQHEQDERDRAGTASNRDDLARAGTAPRFDPGEAWKQALRGHLQGAVAHTDSGDVEAHRERGVRGEVYGAGQGIPASRNQGSEPNVANAAVDGRGDARIDAQDGDEGQARDAAARLPTPNDDDGCGFTAAVRAGRHAAEGSADAADLRGQRAQGFWQGQVRRFPEFSWCENIREVKELFNRPDIPCPLIRRENDGLSNRLDSFARVNRTKCLGNSVVPAVAQVVAERVLEMEANE